MTKLLVLPAPGNEPFAAALANRLKAEKADLEARKFPDGETYLRLLTDPSRRNLAVICTLAHPDDKILPLLFAAAAGRELGAEKIGLVSPYLAYMRQDRRFKPGEAVTSREFARLISRSFDWLVTVDPHLHRYGSLDEIYTIPTRVVHAAPLISAWIRENVIDPVIVGPDSESEQWVSAVARDAKAPYSVLEKTRRGDRDVEISVRNLSELGGRTPVLLDDIVSSGRTMIQAIKLIKARTTATPLCVAVHGLFADSSDSLLKQAGARLVTSNTIPHASNGIDVGDLVADAIQELTPI